MSNLSELLPSGGAQNVVEFTASGAISSGKPVILNSNGTVTQAAETTTTITEDFVAGSAEGSNSTNAVRGVHVVFDSADSNKFIYLFSDTGDERAIKAFVGTISNSGSSTTVAESTTQEIISGKSYVKGFCADPFNAGKFFLAYADEDDSYKGKCVVVTMSGTTLTAGTPVEYDNALTATNDHSQVCADPNVENQFLIVYREGDSAATGKAVVATVSGTSISLGSAHTFKSGTNGIEHPKVFASPNDTGKFVVMYRDDDNSFYGFMKGLSLSGTTISSGDGSVFQSSSNPQSSFCGAFDLDVAGRFVIFFGGYFQNSYFYRQWQGNVITMNTTNLSFTYSTTVAAGNNGENTGNGDICSVGGNKYLMSHEITNGSAAQDLLQIVATVGSGPSLSFGTRNASFTTDTDSAGGISVANDPNNSHRCVTGYRTATSNDNPRQRCFITEVGGDYTSTNLTSTNFIGIASAAISDTAAGDINVKGGINEAQSSLTVGSIYYVQTDGTFATTADDPSVKAGKAISATTINMADL